MELYSPDEHEKIKTDRKKVQKLKPPKRKYIYHNDPDLIRELKIYHLETHLTKEQYIARERKKQQEYINKMSNYFLK